MLTKFIPVIIALALLLPAASQAQQPCLVVGIADGDTLTARCGIPGAYEQIKVRLSAIDAPEKKQPFGNVSRQHLADLCFQQQATITQKSKDRYGRAVADVQCQGKDAGEEQVRAGLAWVYLQYAKGYTRLPPLEADARAARRGLWSDKSPVAPWEWRHPAAGAAPAANHAAAGTCFTGPRGGTYTLTTSGRKNYAAC